jgi:hypothetical protein
LRYAKRYVHVNTFVLHLLIMLANDMLTPLKATYDAWDRLERRFDRVHSRG